MNIGMMGMNYAFGKWFYGNHHAAHVTLMFFEKVKDSKEKEIHYRSYTVAISAHSENPNGESVHVYQSHNYYMSTTKDYLNDMFGLLVGK